jgi:hypothetical protein
MISLEEANKENSVETLFCEKFENLPRLQMSKETTELMIKLILSKPKFNIPEKDKPFLFKLIEKRIETCFTYVITDQKLLLYECPL